MIDYQAMSFGSKARLLAFVVAIAAMVGLIAWIAHTSWERTGELREKLTTVQLQSFGIADHLQQSILELNNFVLHYGVSRAPEDLSRFGSASTNLDRWIDEQRPILATDNEKRVLDLINTNFDRYVAAARALQHKVQTGTEPTIRLAEFAEFESQSQRLLEQGLALASAHRESMDWFLSESNRSLSGLRYALLVSLVLLLLTGSGLAVFLYRDLIRPLRTRLVESTALMERQEKLASLGMLAAGVAHEIRNPLTAIKAWLFIQQKQLRAGTPEFEDARIIGDEINRLERIVKDVLLFARPSEPHLQIVPASEPLERARALLASQVEKANIRIEVEDSVPVRIRVDAQQIQQVLINLIQNAAESMGRNGGVVSLRARLGDGPLPGLPGQTVILEVADNGAGIPPEVEKRLFDPFFTTKETGTGLGLAIAARIVQKHGGSLQYRTRLNHGTTFGIVLPEAQDSTE